MTVYLMKYGFILCMLMRCSSSFLLLDDLGPIKIFDINQLKLPQNEPSAGEGYIVDLLYDYNVFNYCDLSLYSPEGEPPLCHEETYDLDQN